MSFELPEWVLWRACDHLPYCVSLPTRAILPPWLMS